MVDLIGIARIEAAKSLSDTYSITRTVKVPDAHGSFVSGQQTTVTGPCNFYIPSSPGKLEQSGDQVQQRGSYRVKVVATADIRPTDPLVVAGREFRIVWTPVVKAHALFKVIGLEEVGSGARS